MARFLKQNTAVTILIGQLFNWADSKTLVYDALGGNTNFDPAKLVCTLSKGSTQSTLTLTKTGGSNNMNLVNGGMASLVLAAGNVDTCGDLIIAFTNATAGDEVVFPCKFEFTVVDEEFFDTMMGTDNFTVNLSTQAALDVNAECDAAISDAALATAANLALVKAKTDNLPASPAAVGSAMTLTSDYNAAKTAAQAGDKMDIINAPNAQAITAIQSGLATTLNLTAVIAAIDAIESGGDATAANQQTIINALGNIPTKADKPSIG